MHYYTKCSKNVQCSPTLKPISVTEFEETAGPKVPMPSSPLGIFSLLITMTYIVDQSNQFALKCMGEERFGTWTKVTVEELQTYMGFIILMGLVKLPSIYDYWKMRSTTTHP